MAKFNPKALRGLELRSAEIEVPELRPLFDDLAEGENPKFKIRQLDGPELAEVREAAQRNAEARRLRTQAEEAGWSDERMAAIQRLIGGTDEEVPDEHARFLAVVRLGTVEPELDEEQTVQLARFYPVQFHKIGQRIMGLSGLGATEKKSKTSGNSGE